MNPSAQPAPARLPGAKTFRKSGSVVAVFLGCALVLGSGCGKRPEAQGPATEPAATLAAGPSEGTTAPADAPSAAQSDNEAQIAALLSELTQVVRKYSVERRQVPKDFAELVANGYLARVPEAPAGKTFVIGKDLQVQLK